MHPSGSKVITPYSGFPRVNEIFIADAQRELRRRVAARMPRPDILGWLTGAAEQVSAPGSVASILVLDEEGLLRNGSSPRLPADYLRAIDRIKPDPGLGTCAAAAATGEVVITPDFRADDKWGELRHLPLALGFAGAWSTPIKSALDGRVLGTFGIYYRTVREPGPEERTALASLARVAAEALEAE